jgi:hypothetical protein
MAREMVASFTRAPRRVVHGRRTLVELGSAGPLFRGRPVRRLTGLSRGLC